MESEEIEIFKIFKDTRYNPKGALWEVSNYGRVRKNGEEYIPSERKNGYLAFGGHYLVHRAVGELFVPNPEHKKTIDHINRCRFDNRACNLRWATYQEQAENMNWENIRMKLSESLKGIKRSEETKAKIGAAHLGHRHSEETKAKMSAARIGNKNALGKVYVVNPSTEHITRIDPSQLPDYLSKGYIKGMKIKK